MVTHPLAFNLPSAFPERRRPTKASAARKDSQLRQAKNASRSFPTDVAHTSATSNTVSYWPTALCTVNTASHEPLSLNRILRYFVSSCRWQALVIGSGAGIASFSSSVLAPVSHCSCHQRLATGFGPFSRRLLAPVSHRSGTSMRSRPSSACGLQRVAPHNCLVHRRQPC